MDANSTLPLPRVGAGIAEVAEMIGVGRSLLIQADKTGEFGPQFRRIGGRRIASVAEVAAWMTHGMPPRGRWGEMWPQILTESQELAGIGVRGPAGGAARRPSIHGGT